MQDQPSPAYLSAVKPAFPEQQEQLKCPRCESSNTKFCYYNNYNLSQPRHFCKSCRRYWTRGGTLRNVPVGGACRKTPKRPTNKKRPNPDPAPTRNHQARRLDHHSNPGVAAGSFGSILATGDGFGSLLGGLNPDGPGPRAAQFGDFTEELELELDLESGSGLDPVPHEQGNDGTDSYLLQGGESSFIGFGWPDLDVYTHG